METMLISGNTDPGRRRKENQDAYIFRQLWSADKALLAVVDGVGGYAGGEKAAAIARDCIEQYMQIPRGDTLTMLREAVVFANNRIVEERKEDQYFSEMCCVLTAVVADTTTQSVYFAHVGDTRLYRYRNGDLQKITRDHSFVGIKEDAGEISELEAMSHPHRNQILREVGSAPHRLDDEDFMDYGREDLLPGDLWLLCSDGLTDMVTLQQMTTLLSASLSLDHKVSNLIALANEMGGADNITVVLLQCPAAAVPKKVPEAPVFNKEEPAEQSTTNAKGRKQLEKSRMLWIVLLVLLIAAAGWYLSPSNRGIGMLPGPSKHDSITNNKTDSNSEEGGIAPSFRRGGARIPGPGAEKKTDTLRLSATQNFEDLKHYADSTGSTLVLVPAKNKHTRFAAVEITSRSAKPGDTLLMKNLRINNFETGILMRVPVLLKTENLVFDNTRYPFSYGFKPDSSHRSVLFINSAKQ
jgi:serine/threonine protein phosphatase PrpC